MQPPDVVLEQRVAQDRIRTEIQNMPPVYREVIIFRCLEGFGCSRIADIVGCPAGTVMSRISRARAQLRQRLRQHLDEPLS